MKQSIIYKLLYCIGATLCFTSCINEEGIVGSRDNRLSIQVSVKEQDPLTRAYTPSVSVEEFEKIKRCDIFMFPSGEEGVSKHFGLDYDGSPVTSVTKTFESDASIVTAQDVFVIVNDMQWKGLSDMELNQIRKSDLKNLALRGRQNVSDVDGVDGDSIAMIGFKGYQGKSAKEPFVMSQMKLSHDFQTNRTLSLSLNRTYSKVLFVFTTPLEDTDENKDWIGLKSMSIKGFNNIPDIVYVFGQQIPFNSGRYTFKTSNVYKYNFNIDLTNPVNGANVFDTFKESTNKLRIFPYNPKAAEDATSIDIAFDLGPVNGTEVTKTFNRRILIGEKGIEPNVAYIVTIETNKTDDNIKVTTKVAPWNLVSADFPVTPNKSEK